MVSIAAFQAVDPGSIPGQRRIFFFFFRFTLNYLRTNETYLFFYIHEIAFFYICKIALISAVTNDIRPYHVFDAILTGRQTGLEKQCLYGNPMSSNFHKTSLLKNS